MRKLTSCARWAAGVAATVAFAVTAFSAQPPESLTGMRDPAFAPDGKRIAVSWLEAVWTMAPEGRDEKRLVTPAGDWISERDPAWSPDGRQIAFAADVNGAFDVYVAPASGGAARKVTTLEGDERWPSWTRDGRLLFSHRARGGATERTLAVHISRVRRTLGPAGARIATVGGVGCRLGDEA